MLGSLVVIYPTPHEGGELVLRHKDHEWKFNAKTLTAFQPSSSLAYVAFYSDIEHEVLKVTSGRRVTVTYNLYLVDQSSKPEAQGVTVNPQNVSFQTTLQGLLKSPEFLPNGGTLGFGLAHLYPVAADTDLQEMTSRLKGEDAHVYRACRELQLWPSLQMVYDDETSGMKQYGIMLDRVIMAPSYDYETVSYEGHLIADQDGILINKIESANPDHSDWVYGGGEKGEFITWVSPFNERNQLRDITMIYGNELSTGYIYCSPCMIVRIDAASDRM